MLKPILFNGEMVRAILSGNKNKTRRVVKPQPVIRENESGIFELMDDGSFQMKINGYSSVYDYPIYPRYNTGDILWVRETWCGWWFPHGEWLYCYRATDPNGNTAPTGSEYDDDYVIKMP